MGTHLTTRIGATLAVVALTAGGLGLAGCGGDSTPAGTASSAATAGTAAAADNGIASLSGSEILARANTAAKAATSVTVVGTVPQGASDSVSIDMTIGKDDADGTITVKNVAVRIRVTGGNTYINAPAALFEQMGGDAGKVAGGVLGGRWFEVPSTGAVADSFKGLENIADKNTLFSSLLSSSKNPTVKGTGTVLGQPAVILAGPNGGTLAVATTGEPYPLQAKAKAGSTGSVDFRDWNVPVDVQVPTDVVDIGALASLSDTTS